MLELDHNVGPTLQCNTLEDDEQCKHQVIKVSDSKIGIRVLFTAKVALWTLIPRTTNVLIIVIPELAILNTYASVL